MAENRNSTKQNNPQMLTSLTPPLQKRAKKVVFENNHQRQESLPLSTRTRHQQRIRVENCDQVALAPSTRLSIRPPNRLEASGAISLAASAETTITKMRQMQLRPTTRRQSPVQQQQLVEREASERRGRNKTSMFTTDQAVQVGRGGGQQTRDSLQGAAAVATQTSPQRHEGIYDEQGYLP